jgi:nucleoside-diphosphate-sugar epimerase
MPVSQAHNPVLVSGASGFVGNCAARRLLEEGYEVHALLRPEARPWRLRGLGPGFHGHTADVLDGGAVAAVVRVIRPGAVVHLAAHGAYESQSDAERILRTNVLGTLHLLQAAQAAAVRVFVNAGSSSEYGYKSRPMRETDCLEPNSAYGVAKAAQTHLCTVLARQGDTAVVTFRLFSVYGPWEEPTRLMPTALRRARAGLPLELVSRNIARDFVYVDDVLDVLLGFDRLAGLRGEVFNVGSGVQSTLEDVVGAVEAAVGRPVEARWGALPPRRWDTTCWQADVAKTRSALGWSPRFGLHEGVARVAAWMQQMGDNYGPA